ncbi:MAG: HNH endonuclease [Polyangiaceae bacterium]|nr:HNH endonuclease [Polyangiaceae bacterium]MCW5790163.1 HNH endonuclease [Polyangiaceae bacterium]
MDYAFALRRIEPTSQQLDILSMFCAAPGSKLRAGDIAKRMGLSHHAPVNSAVVQLARALSKAAGVSPPVRPDGRKRWWAVIADGRSARGRFVWRLRPALRDALLAEGICAEDEAAAAHTTDERQTAGLFEGALKTVRVNAYERNQVARARCIEHYGIACSVCGVELESLYGPAAAGLIHVHHIRPISQCGGEGYQVDPIKDLRPVCPNCHTVIHRRAKPFSIEELRSMMVSQRKRVE